MKRIYTIFFYLFLAALLNAQEIPNPGFENWNGNTPDGWLPNNPGAGPAAVFPSLNSHSGMFSAALRVIEISGFPFPPTLSAGANGTGFAVSQRHEAFNGWYEFTPQSGDYIGITVQMWEGGIQGTLIGSGGTTIQSAASNWTQFSVPLLYGGPGTPDWCTVQIIVGIDQNSGGEAVIDDLSFGSASDVEPLNNGIIPGQFELSQNYPNPFNPTTNIEYSIPEASFVELKVYDVLGNEVATLVNEEQPAGIYRADFSGSDLTSGLYVARISAGSFSDAIKMTLVR